MTDARTRGQASAVAAMRAMLASGVPHAVLLVGPPGSGKTTLALDFAATLLCGAVDLAERPCGRCRGCRMVRSGNHPDVHRLAPAGPGGQVRIGKRNDPEEGTIRRLIGDLALLPVEGGARVAIIEQADRMNEDAQSALLKTLEEPPAGTTLVLCADEEERLLPTVRSRSARIRLGAVPIREIEELLDELGVAEPPRAARLARIAHGRPGIALAYANAPDAAGIRLEIARVLLDLLRESRARRLLGATELLARSNELVLSLAPAPAGGEAPRRTRSRRDESEPSTRASAAERRRAALMLVDVWRDVARDLCLAALGHVERVSDPGLLDDLTGAGAGVDPEAVAGFLDRLVRAGELLEANVGPELVIDSLALTWPTLRAAA